MTMERVSDEREASAARCENFTFNTCPLQHFQHRPPVMRVFSSRIHITDNEDLERR